MGDAETFWAWSRPFVIEAADEQLAATLHDRLKDLRRRPPRVDGHDSDDRPVVLRIERSGPSWLAHPWSLWRDGEPCEQTVSEDYIVPYVLWEVTRLVLEQATPPVIAMHSAALVHDGRAVAFVGPSHSGKSTMAAWLTRAGWGFLTDEVALLDTTDPVRPVVQPFWRPIGVRRPSPLDDHIDLGVEGSSEVLVPASEIGALGSPAPLTAVVFPTYEDGADGTVEPLHPASALATVANQLPTLVRDGRRTFRSLATLIADIPAYAMRFDDLDHATAQLESLVASLPPSAGSEPRNTGPEYVR